MGALLAPLDASRAKDWADRLTEEFGTLAEVLAAPPSALALVVEDGRARRQLRTVRRAVMEALAADAFAGPVIGSSDTLMAYLAARLAHQRTEQLLVLFLNVKNRLLRDEVMGNGSIDEVPLYPRAILLRALELRAASIILAHNHPSGDPQPSLVDIQATHRIVEAGRALDIVVHDHIIVASTGWVSFRAAGLM